MLILWGMQEPFQVYGRGAVEQMAWVSEVGDLWRTGGDIRASWESIMANTRANNMWALNGKPGHFNDADMLEIGNGQLTIEEQRSHFALWCLMKSVRPFTRPASGGIPFDLHSDSSSGPPSSPFVF